MLKLKKQKTKITDVILLLILGIAAILVFWTFHIIVNHNISSLENNLTADVQKIPMEHYSQANNYSLNYPLGWQVEEKNNEYKETIIKDNTAATANQIDIKIYPQDNLSLLNWIQKRIEQNGKFFLLDDNTMTIANINSMYMRLKEGDNQQSMVVYVPYNNLVYEIKFLYSPNRELSYYQRLFNEITSSFNFD
jgi:hypothetical protein